MNLYEALADNPVFAESGISRSIPEEDGKETPEIFRRLFDECLASLEDDYRDGTRVFVQKNHPVLDKRIGDAWDRIEASWGKDMIGFKKVLHEYHSAQTAAIELFNSPEIPEPAKQGVLRW